MENRTEQKVVYVLPDRELWYGRFTDLYNEISNSTSDLYVGVITPQLDRELRQCPQGAVCGLDWPNHGTPLLRVVQYHARRHPGQSRALVSPG